MKPRYASRKTSVKAAAGTTQKKEMRPPGSNPAEAANRRSSSAPSASCMDAASSTDRSTKIRERTPQCRRYRPPLRFWASAMAARRNAQSSNCAEENHEGMVFSSPASSSLRGFSSPS
jgi:hypothetical protein